MELTEEQKRIQDETLKRADAFEGLVKHEGWKYIASYYENEIKAFVNGLLIGEDKKIEDFEGKRRELIGLRKMIGRINGDIETLNRYREQKQNETK